MSNHYENHNSTIGMQGGNNSGVVQSGEGNTSVFQNNQQFEQKINELLDYVKKEKAESLNIIEDMVSDLRDANTQNDPSKFKKVLGYINGILGPVSQVASIASAVGFTF